MCHVSFKVNGAGGLSLMIVMVGCFDLWWTAFDLWWAVTHQIVSNRNLHDGIPYTNTLPHITPPPILLLVGSVAYFLLVYACDFPLQDFHIPARDMGEFLTQNLSRVKC